MKADAETLKRDIMSGNAVLVARTADGVMRCNIVGYNDDHVLINQWGSVLRVPIDNVTVAGVVF
jgi:hypothetical protein